MKLTIDRSQTFQGTDRKGRSQGVLFTVRCGLELTAAESELVQKHRREDYPLGQATDRHGDPGQSIVTLSRLRQGYTLETRYVSDAIETEEMIKAACASFKGLLGTFEHYGGHEELEF